MNDTQHKEQHASKPEQLPSPTYWPFFMAMGLAFMVWGLLATWMISVAGIGICTIAMVKWVKEWKRESREQ